MNTLYIKDGIKKYKNEIVLIKDGFQIINPSHDLLIEDGWIVYKDEPKTLEQLKLEKIQEIIVWDKSLEVNSFILNGESVWLNKADRIGLMNSIQIEKNVGKTISTVWFNNKKFNIDCDRAIALLSILELYALECYNVTESHKYNVNNLQSEEEINSYDYTDNYPDKLIFEL